MGCVCFVKFVFLFLNEGLYYDTLSLSSIFSHALPLCCYALFRATGRANIVNLSTVQLAIVDATKNWNDILKIHNGRYSACKKDRIALCTSYTSS